MEMETAVKKAAEIKAVLFDGSAAMAKTLCEDPRITVQDDGDKKKVILAVQTKEGVANAYADWYILEIGGDLLTGEKTAIEANWVINVPAKRSNSAV